LFGLRSAVHGRYEFGQAAQQPAGLVQWPQYGAVRHPGRDPGPQADAAEVLLGDKGVSGLLEHVDQFWDGAGDGQNSSMRASWRNRSRTS
jgi:hypothetical protein